jgi:SNF2 family DNA or RNA helicase
MIRRGAIRAFFNRPRRDCRGWKRVSERWLDARAARLPVMPPIWRKLQKHQKVCLLLGALTRRFYYLNDTGTGKTLLIIALARYFKKLGVINRILVLVPARINKSEWVEQIQMHSPSSTYTVLSGSSVDKWRQLEDNNSLFVIETYPGLIRMLSSKIKSKKGKFRLAPDKKLIARFAEQVQGLVGDESFAVQNRGKLPFKICRHLARSSDICFLMTGTPFNRDPTPLWAQMFLIDGGETLGQTLGLFRAAFFTERHNGWAVEYHFDKRKNGLLHTMLANRSISYEADAASLPAVVPIKKAVALPEEAHVYYERARQAILDAKGNFRELRNAFMRMRQISSGFVGYSDDEAGEKAKFVFPQNSKLEMLLSIVASIRPDHKVIVFTEFTYSGERILKELTDMGIGAVHLYGKSKHVDKLRDQFKYDQKIQVLILQNAFGKGLNVQVAKYGIFYESPVSAIDRKQCRRRVERQHSLYKSVFIYDLVTAGTLDEKILSFAQEGANLFDAIVRGKANELFD